MNLKEYIKCYREFIASSVLRITLWILLFISFWKSDWAWVFGCALCILLSFTPSILKSDFKITLPWQLDFLISLALFLHIGGGVLNLYTIIPGYDTLTHFVSSVLVGFMAFVIIYILDEHWEGLQMDVYVMAFFVVITAMAMGVVWELFEWSADLIFGSHEQWGLNDTMKDLLVDTVAGIFIAIIGVNLVKRGKFQEITDEFGEQIDDKILHPKKIRKVKSKD
jgi:uncharacterized membrane protein YjdF